jgi:hypothetical protein
MLPDNDATIRSEIKDLFTVGKEAFEMLFSMINPLTLSDGLLEKKGKSWNPRQHTASYILQKRKIPYGAS